MEEIAHQHAATCTTVAAHFELLDLRFRGIRFLCTICDRESWIRSCESFWIMMQRLFSETVVESPDIFGEPLPHCVPQLGGVIVHVVGPRGRIELCYLDAIHYVQPA